MRLALVVPGGVDRSGEYRVIPAILALIERLAARHDVHVFALHQEAQPGQWRLRGARVHNIGVRRTTWRAIAALRAAHGEAPFDLVHSIFSGSSGLVAVAGARSLRLPSLVHVAGGERVSLPQIAYGGRLTLKGRLREALVLRAATQVTAASAPVIAELERAGIHAARVPLGVDLRAWPPRAPQERLPGRPARLIHVASLNRVKDQPTLLAALSALNAAQVRFHMDIVGEDVLAGAIQRQAAQLGLAERVTFHGFLTQRELRPLMEAADLQVLSSRHEAGPLALLEAAVVGVPTVGTAVGHFCEWAPQAAAAAPVGDPAALARAVATLLADEPARLRLAQGANQRALQEDADFTVRSFEALYARLGAR